MEWTLHVNLFSHENIKNKAGCYSVTRLRLRYSEPCIKVTMTVAIDEC